MTIVDNNKINECVGWIIENKKFSYKLKPKDIYEIVEASFFSGYLLRDKEYKILKEEFKDFFMDFLNQGCGIYNREKEIMEYDHLCLSAYEQGVRRALEEKWITKEQVLR